MLNRRGIMLRIGAAGLLGGGTAWAAAATFPDFLAGVGEEARQAGVSDRTVQRAFAAIRPNDKVLELDRRQAEFTLSWDQYRDGRISQQRVDRGRRAFAENRALLGGIAERFKVSPRVVVAVWGLETSYGGFTGNFNTVEALATLAWDGRRSAFFRAELLAALRILENGDVAPDRMRGSHAGAMGQPQFMPTSFERLAVDFDGDGRRDIWDDKADALGSIANYLANSGWQGEERWGQEVRLPPAFDPALAGRDAPKPLAEWARLGIATAEGSALPDQDQAAALLLPGGAGGQAFMVYRNFQAIRRYNPSDFYALVVGMLSDRVA
jgi:membrane-bound lytic murein transglycosylase B